ncbi:MAG: insulinase family protein [Gammaproteobacteria bacterium]|nr:insulinase family protein [Gammaproteobacteria bacterium]MBT8104048.1 insulinase family protein [Gammaproteobacteria bacterium]NNF50368.1 insulinase family protein [Woeseiaceae bacterium]NNK24063.1 insulinase family protein [Woeseiaceae bacterium]
MKLRCLLLALLAVAGAATAQDIRLPDYERVVLDNGAVLLLAEKHDVPLIGMRATMRGGSVTDPADKAGLSHLLAAALQKGAGGRDAAAFAEAAASVGGFVDVAAALESTDLTAEFLSRDVELMIELVADLLMRPALAEDEFEKERERASALISAARDGSVGGLMPAYAGAFIFGDHAYGKAPRGSESTLAAIEHADLQHHYEAHFGGDRLILSVVGDFDLAAMKARLSEVFGAWEAASGELPTLEPAPRIEGRRVLLVDKPGAQQTYFWMGNVGVGIDYAQRADLRIANTLFGGRFTSMLMTALRVEAGLTYGARSAVAQHSTPGHVTIRSSAETAMTVEAIDMAIALLGKLHEDGADEEMVASARNYIMGQFPPTLETAASLATTFAWLELYGLGRDYIDTYGTALEAVTPETLAAAVGDVYPVSDNLLIVLVGDAEAIRDAVARYGPVTEMSITEPRFRPASE